MQLARVILFTGQLEAMGKFYGETLGLKQVTNEKGWREFAAGGARIARRGSAARGRHSAWGLSPSPLPRIAAAAAGRRRSR